MVAETALLLAAPPGASHLSYTVLAWPAAVGNSAHTFGCEGYRADSAVRPAVHGASRLWEALLSGSRISRSTPPHSHETPHAVKDASANPHGDRRGHLAIVGIFRPNLRLTGLRSNPRSLDRDDDWTRRVEDNKL